MAFRNGQIHGFALYVQSGIECPVIHSRIYGVSGGHGSFLLGIFGVLPTEPGFVLPAEIHCKILHRKRLHDVPASVQSGEIFEHTLVNGTAYRELERRVVPVFHIGEVLVGQKFKQHCRGVARAAFAVGAVPQFAPCPVGVEIGAYVIDHLVLNSLRKVAAGHTVQSVAHLAHPFAFEGIYRQSTHNAVVGGDSRIAVESKSQVKGNVPVFLHAFHPGSACAEIVGVVIVEVVPYLAVDAGPLHIVH